MRILFSINIYKPIHKFQSFVKLHNSSDNKKLSKTQLHKIEQSGTFLGRPLLKIGLSLMKNVLKLSAKRVLIPLGLTAAAKKMFGPGGRHLYLALHPSDLALRTTTLTISNQEMNDIMKIVNSLEESGLLIKGVNKTTKNEAKEQKGGFLIG